MKIYRKLNSNVATRRFTSTRFELEFGPNEMEFDVPDELVPKIIKNCPDLTRIKPRAKKSEIEGEDE